MHIGVRVGGEERENNPGLELQPCFTSMEEVKEVLSRHKGARFKICQSEEEAITFSQGREPQVTIVNSASALLDSPRPAEAAKFRKLKPQDEVKFRKAIESKPSNLEFMVECVAESPYYLVTDWDIPTVLQKGAHHNALHVCARHGRLEAARLVLEWVTGDLLVRLYPRAGEQQNTARRQLLLDRYLNMPDKGGGDTPLHLAAKWGNTELVRLLCSYHQTRQDVVNRHGELAREVVCSRAGEEHKEEVERLLGEQMVIPVYCEDGRSQPGRPLSLLETAELLESSGSCGQSVSSSFCSAVGSPGSLSSPAASSPASPLVQSARGGGRNTSITRPGPGLSALLGPAPAPQATSLYREWRMETKERLCDPGLGAGRQGRQLASKEGLPWLELWPTLGGYHDLTSPAALQLLDTKLDQRAQEARDREERARQAELLDCSIEEGQGDSELELVCSTPARPGSTQSSLEEVFNRLNCTKPSRPASEPLSPLSELAAGLSGLQLSGSSVAASPASLPVPALLTSPPQDPLAARAGPVLAALEQFANSVAPLLADCLPATDEAGRAELGEWLAGPAHHWAALRRQVNNWRSDPRGRWAGLDWAGLAGSLTSLLCEAVTLELGTGLDRERCARLLTAAALQSSPAKALTTQEAEYRKAGWERRAGQQPGERHTATLREVGRLAGAVARQLQGGRLAHPALLAQLWDRDTDHKAITTENVNKARKFLHSNSKEKIVAAIAGNSQQDDEVIILEDENKCEELVEDVEVWGTPPSSPAGSSVSSLVTCGAGPVVWLGGAEPGLEDRRVGEALQHLDLSALAQYPALQGYLANLRSYSPAVRRGWTRSSPTPLLGMTGPRILNLDQADITF